MTSIFPTLYPKFACDRKVASEQHTMAVVHFESQAPIFATMIVALLFVLGSKEV
jgi:hypothetical protein